MIRTQVQLREEQVRALKRLAADRGGSVASLIREAIDRLVEDERSDPRWRRALAAVGKFKDREGASDVSVEHDRYLEDAYLDWRR